MFQRSRYLKRRPLSNALYLTGYYLEHKHSRLYRPSSSDSCLLTSGFYTAILP